jgi:hypothetical protein
MASGLVTIFSIQTMLGARQAMACAEWLVGADGFGDHLFDPGGWRILSRGDLGGVGRAGAEDDLGVGGQVADGVDEVGDAFLAGDAADEEDVGNGGVDAVVR